MKNRFLGSVSALAAAIVLGGAASTARADGLIGTDPYVQLFGGYAVSSGQSSYYDDVYDQVLKDGFVAGVAFGSYIRPGLRLEQELSYVHNGAEATAYDDASRSDYDTGYSGDISSIYLLGNLWKDLGSGTLRPYVGGGLGVGFITNDSNYSDGDNGWNDTGFGLAAQLGGGVRFGLSDQVAVDLGYRLKAIVDATFDDIGIDENGGSANSIYTQSFQLGASYSFGGQALPDAGEGGNWYVSLFGGAALPGKNGVWSTASVYLFEGKTGFTMGAAVGTELAEGLRGELEVSYLNYALDSYSDEKGSSADASGNFEAAYILANLWRDFDLGMVRPYFGGGLGFASARVSEGDLDGDIMSEQWGLSLAGQFGLGARIDMADHLQLDLGYRFKSVIESMIQTEEDDDFDNAELASYQHVFQAGLTYNLGEGTSIQPTADVPDMADQYYVSLFGGAAFPANTHIASNGSNYIAEFKTGFTVGAAFGATLGESMRSELELSYLASDVDKVTEADSDARDTGNSIAGTFLLANLWQDMHVAGFTPYFGGGVGVALMNVDIILDRSGSDQVDESSLALAGQIGAGIRYDVTDKLTLDAGYRLKAALGVATEGAEDSAEAGYASYYANIGQLGMSWKF